MLASLSRLFCTLSRDFLMSAFSASCVISGNAHVYSSNKTLAWSTCANEFDSRASLSFRRTSRGISRCGHVVFVLAILVHHRKLWPSKDGWCGRKTLKLCEHLLFRFAVIGVVNKGVGVQGKPRPLRLHYPTTRCFKFVMDDICHIRKVHRRCVGSLHCRRIN